MDLLGRQEAERVDAPGRRAVGMTFAEIIELDGNRLSAGGDDGS